MNHLGNPQGPGGVLKGRIDPDNNFVRPGDEEEEALVEATWAALGSGGARL